MPRSFRTFLLFATLILALAAVVMTARRGGRKPGPVPTRGHAPDARSQTGKESRAARAIPPKPTLADLQQALKGVNVVIVVLDAARADHFGCYGYPRDTTPNIDRLGAESVIFDQHFCPYPATTPSTASLLTGLYPDTHGVFGALGPDPNRFQRMIPGTSTLEQALKGAGYYTFMATANVAASPTVGIGEDFDSVSSVEGAEAGPRGRGGRDSVRQIVAKFSRGLQERGDRHFFAYLHFLPPHFPYYAPDDIKALFSDKQPPDYFHAKPLLPEATRDYRAAPPPEDRSKWVNLYDANLRWGDQGVGAVRDMLAQNGLLDDTLFIVTADHGEALGEHDYVWHENVPYDEALHIPLLMRFPGGALRTRVPALTQTVDVMPTILDLLGLACPKAVQGRSLAPLITGASRKVRDFAYTQTWGPYYCRVVRDQRRLLLQYEDGPGAVYDLSTDPRETHPLSPGRVPQAAGLREALSRFRTAQQQARAELVKRGKNISAKGSSTRQMSVETRRQLEALGYLK